MKKYVGITIGPIFDTISEASSPIALWFASIMFSDITARLCKKIKSEEGFADAEIYSPCFCDIQEPDGIGRYHDRVFFSTNEYDKNKMDDIVDTIKIETAEILGEAIKGEIEKTKKFLKEFLQIHYVVVDELNLENDNCIMAMSYYLDSLELMKTFTKGDEFNPIQTLFKDNNNVKKTLLIPTKNDVNKIFVDESENRRIREIENIAWPDNKCKTEYKKHKYFALVTADADNMGKFLKTLSNENIKAFSEACLNYAGKAAAKIKEHNGMTIYAGGDDLLFLAPVENVDGKTILDLCNEISKVFKECIEDLKFDEAEMNLPTVSFGISIQYVKYPLYEAIARSRTLLEIAKNTKGKDMMVINLQKHSGQSVMVRSGNERFSELKFLLSDPEVDLTGEDIHSILFTLENMKKLVKVLNKDVVDNKVDCERYVLAWKNLFDNDGQSNVLRYVEMVAQKHFEMIQNEARVYSENTEDLFDALLCVLRIKKFLKEKGDENQ